MTPRPPRLAKWLVRVSTPIPDRDVILGDLEEEFRGRAAHEGERAARAWYRRQAWRSVPHQVRRRLGRREVDQPRRRGRWLDGLPQDIRHAFRSLRSTPSFTIAALAVLAMGIGATTAIYSLVDGVVLRGLGFPDDGRLVLVSEPATRNGRGNQASIPEFHDWRALQSSFTDLGASRGGGAFLRREGDTVEPLRVTAISASLLSVLRASPAIGRPFTATDEVPGSDHVLLLSDAYWRRRFAARRDVIGKTLTFDSGDWTIVGVMPASFMYPAALTTPMDMWTPIAPAPADLARDGKSDFPLTVIGRLKPGVTVPLAQADLERVTAQLRPTAPRWFAGRGLKLASLRDTIIGPVRSWMLMLLGSVAFVLLLACVNVANLLLARASARARDAAVRTALGASRWRLLRGLLVESLMLSMAGTALGVALALCGVDILRGALPANLPRLAEVAINSRVLLAAAALSILVALAVTPIWQGSTRKAGAALRDAGRSGSAGPGRSRTRTVLLCAEIALAVILLIGSGLFVSSFVRLLRVDLGFETTNVLQVDLSPRGGRPSDAAIAALQGMTTAITDQVSRVPGIEQQALVSGTPPLMLGNDRTSITVPGSTSQDSDIDDADEKLVSAAYFDVLHVPVIRGRAFTDQDVRAGAAPVVILNDVTATRLFGQTDPIGALVSIGDKDGWTVVGVVHATRLQGPESDPRPELYTPLTWQAFRGNPLLMLIVRTSRDPRTLTDAIKGAVHAAAPDLPAPAIRTYDELFGGFVAQRKFNMLVLALFGCLALAIAGTGIYGVMAYVVEQRTREIGVRMALGAAPSRVIRMVLGSAVKTMVTGLSVGLVGGWLLSRFVRAFLFNSDAHDPGVYLGAAVVLVAVGLIAAIVPARRASAVDPLVALRTE